MFYLPYTNRVSRIIHCMHRGSLISVSFDKFMPVGKCVVYLYTTSKLVFILDLSTLDTLTTGDSLSWYISRTC